MTNLRPSTPDCAPPHILIVDDTPRNIQVLGMMLRAEGFRINTALDGREALKSVETVRPDVILLDIMMPVMDGFETCSRLKANPDTQDIPVIFLTSLDDTASTVRGFEVGGVDYVTKPFREAELLSRIRTHLQIRDLQSRLKERIGELKTALTEIERLNREQNAMLRHELNNEVMPLISYAELLRSRIASGQTEKIDAFAENVYDSARSLGDLLRALRDLQSFERGENTLTIQEVDLVELVESVAADIQAQFNDAVPIRVAHSGDPVSVPADPFFLPGVFRNLIKNAAEHVQNLDPQDRTVTIRMSFGGDSATVAIHNGGPPIPAELHDTFFDKFNSTKKESGGTGLGTSYAFLVTRAHGGQIGMTSSLENGTVVTVALTSRDPSL